MGPVKCPGGVREDFSDGVVTRATVTQTSGASLEARRQGDEGDELEFCDDGSPLEELLQCRSISVVRGPKAACEVDRPFRLDDFQSGAADHANELPAW
jgi:hypothetical protein